MVNNNNSQNSENGASLIGEGLNVEDDLNCKGSIEVAGIMNGNIIANGLKVLETGSIIGGVKQEDLKFLVLLKVRFTQMT